MSITIETERLLIRGFTVDDVDQTAHALGMERDEADGWLRWLEQTYVQLARLYQPPYGERAVVLKATGAVIGAVGVVPSMMPFGQLPYFSTRIGQPVSRYARPEVGMFWAIAPEQRRQGYATEAARALLDWMFAEMNLGVIVATTEYDNLASQAVMRRLGMTLERNPYPEPFYMQVVGIADKLPA